MASSTALPDDVAMTSTMRTLEDLRRDRVADLVRVASLGVVIIWHSTLSLFHRGHDGVLSMPNPIGEYSGLWLATWALQVMPLFFIVSGAVNADSWERHRLRGRSQRSFTTRRLASFAPALGILGAVSLIAEVVSRMIGAGPLMSRNMVILVPLWTLALLLAYAPLTPLLDRATAKHGPLVTAALVGTVALSDLLRFRASLDIAGAVSTITVWLLAYQLGWVYRSAVRSGADRCRTQGRMLAFTGLVGLVVSTNIGVYPRSMVATTTDTMSNLLPTTFPVAALALMQCGLLLWARPHLARWLRHEGAWQQVQRLGRDALPAYLLHMIPLVALVSFVEAVAPELLPRHASATWWLSRPLWLAVFAWLLVPVLRIARRPLGSAR